MASRTICKFWLQGQCKFGDNCKFEHSRNTGNRYDNNRFSPLNDSRNHGNNNNSRNQGNEPRDRPREQSNQDHYIDKDQLRRDLSTERPLWNLSCYSPRPELPRNLFGGPERELSPEEMRFRFYELASQGKMQDATREADVLHQSAINQMENALRDVSGAIRYLLNGHNDHPNRIDICNECTKTGVFLTEEARQNVSSSNVVGPFTQSSRNTMSVAPSQGARALPFGQPSVPNTNSTFGQPSLPAANSKFGQATSAMTSTFGQPSMATGTSAFGQPTRLGTNSAFGQSGLAQASAQSAFGRPSLPGASQTAFGQPSGGTVSSSPFGQPSQPAGSSFGQPSSPFSQKTLQAPMLPNPFTTQTTNQVDMQMSPVSSQSPFAASSGGFAASSSFQQTQNGFPSANTAPRHLNSTNGTFGQSSGGGFAKDVGVQGLRAPMQNITNGTGTSAVKGVQGKLQSWKGRQVQYFDNEPCYREGDGFWQRIWFPDEQPAWNKPETLPTDLPYDNEVEEQFKLASTSQQFSYGAIPLIPPKREWIDWDF